MPGDSVRDVRARSLLSDESDWTVQLCRDARNQPEISDDVGGMFPVVSVV